MHYDTHDERDLAEADPELPFVPKRRGPLVLSQAEFEALVKSLRREPEPEDEPNDLRRDLEHEDGSEEDDYVQRRSGPWPDAAVLE